MQLPCLVFIKHYKFPNIFGRNGPSNETYSFSKLYYHWSMFPHHHVIEEQDDDMVLQSEG
jgi:hypothetical protein